MSEDVVLTLLGAVLLLVGLLGGGFELKELKIPRVGWAARIPALIAGCVLLVVGIGLGQSKLESDTTRHAAHDPLVGPAPADVFVTIFDDLGEQEVSEQVVFRIDGRDVGVLNVNSHYPHASLRVRLPAAGKYSYMAAARAHFRDAPDEEYAGVGQGMVDVRDGQEFDIEGETSGPTWLVSLHERVLAAR